MQEYEYYYHLRDLLEDAAIVKRGDGLPVASEQQLRHVRKITDDSRQVGKDDIFVAIKGRASNGHDYIDNALAAGALLVIAEKGEGKGVVKVEGEKDYDNDSNEGRILWVEDSRDALARLAACYYDFEGNYNDIVAITGTDGKTSIAWLVRELWQVMGRRAVSIGTLGVMADGNDIIGKTGLTTPGVLELYRILAELPNMNIGKGNGSDYGDSRLNLAIEASSIALEQHRIGELPVNIAVWSNIAQDHLDYHGDMDNYRQAKLKLFEQYLQKDGVAVIYRDCVYNDIDESAYLIALCDGVGLRVISYGESADCDLRLLSSSNHATGQKAKIMIYEHEYELFLPLFGRFQLLNMLAAIGVMMAKEKGVDYDELMAAVGNISQIPGRMELVGSKNFVYSFQLKSYNSSTVKAIYSKSTEIDVASNDIDHNHIARVFVDYAHTPGALEQILHEAEILRRDAGGAGQIIVVFGCGGERDIGKRAQMGAIAASYANMVVVTDDNPRHEDAAEIRAQIMQAASQQKEADNGEVVITEIADRKDAIKYAIIAAEENDIVIIAGKGHETDQVIGDEVIEHDDRAVVAEMLAQMNNFK